MPSPQTGPEGQAVYSPSRTPPVRAARRDPVGELGWVACHRDNAVVIGSEDGGEYAVPAAVARELADQAVGREPLPSDD